MDKFDTTDLRDDRDLGKRFPEILAAAGLAMNHDTPESFIAG